MDNSIEIIQQPFGAVSDERDGASVDLYAQTVACLEHNAKTVKLANNQRDKSLSHQSKSSDARQDFHTYGHKSYVRYDNRKINWKKASKEEKKDKVASKRTIAARRSIAFKQKVFGCNYEGLFDINHKMSIDDATHENFKKLFDNFLTKMKDSRFHCGKKIYG